MADSASRAQRAAALEEKRRKLEELKQKRALRKEDTAKVKERAETQKASLDEYIDGLLSQPSVVSGGAAMASSSSSQSSFSDNFSNHHHARQASDQDIRGGVGGGSSDGNHKTDHDYHATTTTTDQQKNDYNAESSAEAQPAASALSAFSSRQVVETFVIGTQTEVEDFPDPKRDEDEPEEESDDAVKEAEKAAAESIALSNQNKKKEQEEKIPKLLTEEEVEKEIVETPFTLFITTASKKVERVMGTPLLSELLSDYIGEADEDGDRYSGENANDSDASRYVSSRQVYQCKKWTHSRDVTDMDWSPLHRDIFLSTYHMPNSTGSASPLAKGSAAISAVAPNDTLSSSLTPRTGEVQSDGLALVWSLSMPERPEHVFTCGSPVTSGRFHPSEATLVLGGCESGQLVVWDVRAGRLPVQKSALTTVLGASAKSHTHPICSMEIIEGGLGLVTASIEGRVNYWSLGNLREPVESIQVGESVSCFAVAPESETLILGDEHGLMYSISASGGQQRSARKQLRKLDSTLAAAAAAATTKGASGAGAGGGDNYTTLGHYGMITSISTKILKPGSSLRTAGLSKGFLRGSGGLVLTCGVDWTVKLWSPAYSDAPLMSLVSHSYDYMCDAKWSPVHPSLFATASSNGTVGLWNLATSLDVPMTGKDGIVVEQQQQQQQLQPPHAPAADTNNDGPRCGLNKISWSADGRRMAVASGDLLHVLNLTEDVARPKGDEDQKAMNQLMARGLVIRQ